MKYYIAYGSNLNIKQMAWRCPTAKKLHTAELVGYRLEFRAGRGTLMLPFRRMRTAKSLSCSGKYSRMMNGLKQANITINRKILADLAVNDAAAFAALANQAKAALK